MIKQLEKNRPRILLVTHSGFPQGQVDEIKSSIPEVEYITVPDNMVYEKAAGINALIGCPRSAFNEELLNRAGRNLKWVHASGAGVEEFLFPKFVKSNIIFTNGKIIQGPEVADHALGLLLTLTRNLQLVLREKTQNMPRPVELHKKNALVVGLGGIGLLIAERAAAPSACGSPV